MPYKFSHFLKALKLMGGYLLPRLKAMLIGAAIVCGLFLIAQLFINYFWYTVGVIAFIAFVAFCLWLWFSLEEVKREEKR